MSLQLIFIFIFSLRIIRGLVLVNLVNLLMYVPGACATRLGVSICAIARTHFGWFDTGMMYWCNGMETYQRAEDDDYMYLILHVSNFRLRIL